MSDSFQSYVFSDIVAEHRSGHFGRVQAYLLNEEIISERTADNTLEGDGHEPGRRADLILIEDGKDWRRFDVRGVKFATGRIIEASTELTSGRCPRCNVEIKFDAEVFPEAYDAIDAYHEDGSADLVCPSCDSGAALDDWDFGHGLVFGFAKVTFWNWPPHVDDLAARLQAVSGCNCTKVEGKI